MHKFARKSWAVLLFAALLALSGCIGPVGGDKPSVQSDPSSQSSGTPAPTSPVEDSAPEQSEGRPDGSDVPVFSATEPAARPEPAVSPAPVVSPGPGSSPEPSPIPKVTGLVGLGEAVEESWFADAVFVGDSRTDGLKLYSGIKSATFISHQGLSVFNIAKKECIERDGVKVTALDALGAQEYVKVYLMLGVNELGYGSESFREAYTGLVQQIMELQPNATVYLQTILPVNEPMAASHGINAAITNERVKVFNGVIADIAQAEGAALVDVANLFWTENGEIAKENTSDGVHLTRKGYVAWFEYLKSHTGTTEPVEEPVQSEPPAETGDPEPTPDEPPAAEEPAPGELSVAAEPAPGEPPAIAEPMPSEPPVAAEPAPDEPTGIGSEPGQDGDFQSAEEFSP